MAAAPQPHLSLGESISSELRSSPARYTFSVDSRGEVAGQGEEADTWDLRGRLLSLDGSEGYVVRSIQPSDADALLAFLNDELSERSRQLFAPYPYGTPGLMEAVRSSISDSQSRATLSLVVTPAESAGRVAAHGFLWAASSDIPELGVAVADCLQKKGLGAATVGILLGLARSMGRAGVELTTMEDNEGAYRCYAKCGFEEQGTIRNPLGCDATEAMEGRAMPTGFADERQMLRVLDEARRETAEAALAAKRRAAARLFGAPE